MLSFAVLASILATTTATSIPRQIYAATPANTTVAFFQGGSSSDACSGTQVGSWGEYTAGVCNDITVYGLGIGESSTNNCVFTLYKDSKTCNGTEASSVVGVSIPQGYDQFCIDAGVYDGGKNVLASGIWSCF
ncbi:hypothetical protein LTR56_017098 [Elasticomyces elasticus]|nr:hypothetical protein LTR56_017098 [Elasticomyces elasticus]KAK3643668.1 hypothetical protein LTR22_015586 [Elasticomyces elasticus]KAK4915160.1 hypothetical protein LTR49_016669 [Elasticomyces elasticus]KAK5749316.1 hypothetical protein LTS12_020634 [Elasticomyces elasticus]